MKIKFDLISVLIFVLFQPILQYPFDFFWESQLSMTCALRRQNRDCPVANFGLRLKNEAAESLRFPESSYRAIYRSKGAPKSNWYDKYSSDQQLPYFQIKNERYFMLLIFRKSILKLKKFFLNSFLINRALGISWFCKIGTQSYSNFSRKSLFLVNFVNSGMSKQHISSYFVNQTTWILNLKGKFWYLSDFLWTKY